VSDGPQLTPQSYLYQRAHQIQEDLLPKIAAEKEKIQPIADAQLAQLTELEAVLRAEFEVLQAASTVLPAEVVPISEVTESNTIDFPSLEGGAE
jgi:esterase/lipase